MGTADVTVRFKGNYKGNKEQTVSFQIDPAVLGRDILAHDAGAAYTGKAQKPVPVLTWAATGKAAATRDFNVDYDKSVKEAGTYVATVKAKSENFKGEATARITVEADKNKLLSKAKVEFGQKSYAYTGKKIIPTATLTLGGTELPADAYQMTCYDNLLPGTARVIFEAVSGNAGGYAGTKTMTFKITEKKAGYQGALVGGKWK